MVIVLNKDRQYKQLARLCSERKDPTYNSKQKIKYVEVNLTRNVKYLH